MFEWTPANQRCSSVWRSEAGPPDLGSEVGPGLVGCECLSCVPNAAGRLVADVEVPIGNRHHRVPDAEEDDVDRREGVQRRERVSFLTSVAVDPLQCGFYGLLAVLGDVVVEEARQVVGVVLGRQSSGPVEEARDGLRSGGAAAEPEDEHFVAGLVVVREELECLFHVFLEAGSPATAQHPVGNG